MFDYQSIKVRLSPWIAFFVGGILVLWAIVEKKSAVGFGDLYPGVALIAAGLLLLGFLKYVGRGPKNDGTSAQNSESDSSADTEPEAASDRGGM